MSRSTIIVSVNASWNIYNFRRALVRALLERGHDVIALAPEDEYSVRLDKLGVAFVPIAIDSKGVSPLNDLGLLARYRAAMSQLGADLFIGYTVKPNIYGSMAAASLGIPAINNISGLGTAFIRTGPLNWLVSNLYRVALRHSATVFFQNRDDRDLFVAKSLVREDQARLLPGSGIDLEHFQSRPLPNGPGVRFLMMGRLLWDKGVREYAEAARMVRERHPTARFTMLGFVDVPNRTAVGKNDIDIWSKEGVIDYLPACEDVRPHIEAADCVVLPSYREGLPRALLEGAAMARPLIATNVPGCRDVIQDGVNGYSCVVRDAASLAEAMIQIIDAGSDRRRQMGREGRRMVEARFGQELVVQSYLEAVEAALASRPAA